MCYRGDPKVRRCPDCPDSAYFGDPFPSGRIQRIKLAYKRVRFGNIEKLVRNYEYIRTHGFMINVYIVYVLVFNAVVVCRGFFCLT